MSDKERYQNWINNNQKELDDIDKLSLGMLLKLCVHTLQDWNSCKHIRVGHFSFYVKPHDTGNDVIVKLYSEDGDSLEIINKTYWYFVSHYRFNKYTHLHGAWDDALDKTIEQIRQQCKDVLIKQIENYQAMLDEIKLAEKCVLDKFNKMFGGKV